MNMYQITVLAAALVGKRSSVFLWGGGGLCFVKTNSNFYALNIYVHNI